MSGNDPSYYYAANPMYPPGYGQWANWVPNPAMGYSAAQMTSNTTRNQSPFVHNGAYLHTRAMSPDSTSQISGVDNQNSATRSAQHYSSQHSYYNRNYGSHAQSSRVNNWSSNGYMRQKDYGSSSSSHGNYNNWQQRNNYKRGRDGESSEHKNKQKSKKKKSLAENAPRLRDWTTEDAKKALNVEQEYNRIFKNRSLIIKFPDLELNKDIVSNFHSTIENVHFQQPSTARFCFVTLKKDANAEAVIEALNKVKFGDGFLTAEFKKDRDEEQIITPDDIDPLTLYVGNLAQDVTKEDVHKRYPKNRRIDIGYAKKMKYTRYAFVSFFNVEDSIEAFRTTRCTEMHAKSMIVRFRRLKGTVGMPGETKQQNPPRSRAETSTSMDDSISRSPDSEFPSLLGDPDYPDYYYEEDEYNSFDSKDQIFNGNIESSICNDILAQSNDSNVNPTLRIKQEPLFDPTPPPPPPEEEDIKPDIKNIPPLPISEDVPNEVFERCVPKVEIKIEKDDLPSDDVFVDKSLEGCDAGGVSPKPDLFANVQIKTEPESGVDYYEGRQNETLDELEFNNMWHKKNLGIEGFS